MGILEIVLIGLVVNIVAGMSIIILGVILGMISNDSEKMIILNLLNEKEHLLRNALRLKGKPSVIQEDFVKFIPFSGILTFIDFIAGTAAVGVFNYFINTVNKRIVKLEERLDLKEDKDFENEL